MRDRMVSVHLSEVERQWLEERAARLDCSLSRTIRDLVRAEMKREREKQGEAGN